ncbi:MAG: ABC transporter substrate-binding protein [Streptosporangiaceae bacterium]
MRRLLPALIALGLGLAACGGAGSGGGGGGGGKGPIKIGMITSLTGNYTPLGKNDRLGARQAVKEANKAGGIDGRKLKLIVKDDKTEPNQAVIDFNDLAGQDVVGVVGSSFSNSSLAAIPVAARKKIPYISTAASDEQVQPPQPYIYMTPPTAGVVAERLLQYFKAKGMTKLAIAYDTKSAFAQTGHKAMSKMASKYGVSFVDTETFETTQTDFSSVLTHVRSSHAQGLMVWATGSPAVVITKQFATSGMDMPLIMSHAEASTLYTQPAGKAAEGVTVASSLAVIGPYLPDSKLKDTVTSMAGPFKKKAGYYPPQFAFDGYSAVKLLAAAMKKGGTDPEQIEGALEHMKLLTPEGEYNYTPKNHAGLGPDDVAVTVVKNGEFVPTAWTKRQLKSGLS